MKISVIIPTYNRRRMLLQTVCSLQEQTLSGFEIIVVDNAGDPQLERGVEEFNATAMVPALYVSEPRMGAHNARHTGAHVAKGDLLIFTDDDMSFDTGWLKAYAEAFSQYLEMGAAAGPVRPFWEESPPKWLLDYIGTRKEFFILSLMEPYDTFQLLKRRGYFFSCNMAIRKDLLQARGGFHPDIANETLLGDGEVGLYRKMWANGDLIGYVPGALAYHHIPPSRMTLKYFRHRMANEGASDVYTRFHDGVPGRLRLLKHAIGIGVRNGRCWLTALVRKGRTDKRSVDIQINAARTQSQLKYVIRLILNKELRRFVVKRDWMNESCPSVSCQA